MLSAKQQCVGSSPTYPSSSYGPIGRGVEFKIQKLLVRIQLGVLGRREEMNETDVTNLIIQGILEQNAKLEASLNWFVHLCHDVGKAGGKPEKGEWEAAIEEAEKILKENK